MRILISGVHGFVGRNLVTHHSPEKTGVIWIYSWDDVDASQVPEVDAKEGLKITLESFAE